MIGWIDCVFGCMIRWYDARWSLSALGSPENISPVAQSLPVTLVSPYPLLGGYSGSKYRYLGTAPGPNLIVSLLFLLWERCRSFFQPLPPEAIRSLMTSFLVSGPGTTLTLSCGFPSS